MKFYHKKGKTALSQRWRKREKKNKELKFYERKIMTRKTVFNFLRNVSLLCARAVCELSEGGSQKWAGTEQLATYADKHKGLMVFLKDSKKGVNQGFGFRGFSPERQTLNLKEIEIG